LRTPKMGIDRIIGRACTVPMNSAILETWYGIAR
jgi:hypothetical protein